MQPENTPNEPVAPAPSEPQYVGNSNIRDRSDMASVYPEASSGALQTPSPVVSSAPPSETRYSQASSSLNNAVIIVCGLGSSVGYFLASFAFKNGWVALFVALALAVAALVFSIKEYRSAGKMSPLQVVGLSGASFTFVLVLDYIVLRLMIHSLFNALSY